MLLWAAVITLLSRSEFHAGYTYGLLRAALRFLFPEISGAVLYKINAVVRKLAHVTEYFLLAALVWRALRRGAVEFWRREWALGTLAAGLLVASLDELHQTFEPGRQGSPLDVGVDSLGILLALVVLYVRARLRTVGRTGRGATP